MTDFKPLKLPRGHMTSAQDDIQAKAVQWITDGIAALPVAQASGILMAALILHPDMTPELLHTTANTLSRAADDMARKEAK